MFKGQPNVFDDLITKATDENNTGEDWETILNICDKVQEEGEPSARNAIAALLKRLAHRSPNVQLYALSVAEALSKNCGVTLHRELASRDFTQGLERLVTDRNTHDKVRKRALSLIAMWTSTFENDPSLGVMEECYHNLRAKNYQYETPAQPPPPTVDDEVRRREEADLQRALEISLHENRNGYPTSQPSLHQNGGGSGSGSGAAGPSPSLGSAYSTGYSVGRTPPVAASSTSSIPAQTAVATTAPPSTPIVTRVRALHTFEATETGELAFERGEIIRVVDRAYRDWWRGHLRGRSGIFPVNYVEAMPEPSASELAREAEQETAVFTQAANVDRLLTLLRGLDSSGERLADNEEIQELYRSCMALRPKIVKLIDKYSQKRADLVLMNEAFVKARTIFDRMMEESLARHTGGDPARGGYAGHAPVQQEYGAQPYDPTYEQQSPAQYVAGQPGQYPISGYSNPTQSPYPGMQPAQSPYLQGPPASHPLSAQPLDTTQSSQPQPQPHMHSPPVRSHSGAAQSPYLQGPPASQPLSAQPLDTTQSQPQPQPHMHSPPVRSHSGAAYVYDPNGARFEPSGPQPWTGQSPQSQQSLPYAYDPNGTRSPSHVGQQPQTQARHSPQAQQAAVYDHDVNVAHTPSTEPYQQQQQQQQQQPPAQEQQQRSPRTEQGPPYVYDPNMVYADENVQAWAQYYAQGGKDPAGAVYFISVPGVTGGVEEGPAQGQAQTGQVLEQAGEQGGQGLAAKPSPTSSQEPTGHGVSGALAMERSSASQSAGPAWQLQQQPYGYTQPHSYSSQQHVTIPSTGSYTS